MSNVNKDLYIPLRLHKTAKNVVEIYLSVVRDILPISATSQFDTMVKGWKAQYRGTDYAWQYAFFNALTCYHRFMNKHDDLFTSAPHQVYTYHLSQGSYSFESFIEHKGAFTRKWTESTYTDIEQDIIDNVLPVLHHGIDCLRGDDLRPSLSGSAILQQYMTEEQKEWVKPQQVRITV